MIQHYLQIIPHMSLKPLVRQIAVGSNEQVTVPDSIAETETFDSTTDLDTEKLFVSPVTPVSKVSHVHIVVVVVTPVEEVVLGHK